MALTRQRLANRLREVRENLGFTQAEVASVLGLHRPAVSEIEAGRRAVTSDEIYRLAGLFAVPIHELLGAPAPTAPQVERMLFRRAGAEQRLARTALRHFIERCRAERELEELLGIDMPPDERPRYDTGEPRSVIHAVRQGESIASQERRRLDLGSEPLRNPVELLERQGVRIGPLAGAGAEGVDGVFFELVDVGSCVALNPDRDSWTGSRAAFTVSHEYAHWLLRDVAVEEFRFESGTDDLKEARANAFAAAFLMPEQGLRDYFEAAGLLHDDALRDPSPAQLVLAMDHFGVSKPALLYRLQNLQLLDPERGDELRRREFPVTKVAKALGLRPRRGRPIGNRLRQLAVEAWRKGAITATRAGELLDVDAAEFRRRMAVLGVQQQLDENIPLIGVALEE